MKDFNAAIREIEEKLGDGGSRKLAETIYARLMADGLVTYTRDGVVRSTGGGSTCLTWPRLWPNRSKPSRPSRRQITFRG